MPETTPDREDDILLIGQYKKTGDMQLLGTLYKKYMHLVYGLCLKYLKDRQESQDEVMHIFEKLVDKLKTQEIENFKSWLYVLSKNHCLMKLRSSKYKTQQKTVDISSTPVESDLLLHHTDETLLEDDLNKLEQCIEKLQNEQKQCVALFYLQNKPYKEIEKQTQFELKKIKSYIQNGKRNLKLCMEKDSENN